MLRVEKYLGVVRRNCFDGRLIKRPVIRDVGTAGVAAGEFVVVVDINLIDTAKATEFALDSVVVAMVIAVSIRECDVTPSVMNADTFDAVHRKWQPSNPWIPCELVFQIELG